MARHLAARRRAITTGPLGHRDPHVVVIGRVQRRFVMWCSPLMALALALLLPVSALGAATARTMFESANEKEQAVRAALADPAVVSATVLKSARRTVATYEAVVRRYPTSGYCDNALWQAAHLAMDAFGKFGETQDRETGLRLLRWLASEYPTSRLAKRVPDLLTATRGDGGGAAAAKANPAAKAIPAAKASPTAIPSLKTASLSKIQRSLLPDVVRVTIALDAEVPFHDERIAGPSRIFIDLPGTRATASLVDQTLRFDEDHDLVRHVRIGRQPNTAVRVVLDAAGVSSYSVYPIYNPYRLVIDCVRATPPAAPFSTVRLKPDATSDPLRTRPGADSDSVRGSPAPPGEPARTKNEAGVNEGPTRSDPTVDSARAKSGAVASPEPGRPALPIVGHRIAATWAGALPSTTPNARAVLEAARMPPTLTSRPVTTDWARSLPNASPAATALILEAVRVPTILPSRPAASVWGRSLPNVSPVAAATILEAMRVPAPAILTSRPLTTASARGLPNTSPAATATILEAARVPAILASRWATTAWSRGLLNASPGGAAAIAEAFAVATPESTAVSAAVSPTPAPLPSGSPAPGLGTGFSMARQLGLSVSRIVIDPGHGGHDPGAKGKGGITEAELVLDVSLRLEKLLEKVPGVEVILTRKTDEFVALPERTAIANREGADLFLSIHANASPNDQAHGVETYFLNFANNLSAAAVAARENATSGQAMGALPDFVRAIALNNKLDESRNFATLVQQSMMERLATSPRDVDDQGLREFLAAFTKDLPEIDREFGEWVKAL